MADAALQGTIFNIQKFSIHDGPGIRTTVFMKGCPLRCRWCSNPESQRLEPQMMGNIPDSKRYAVEEVLAICMQDQPFYEESGGGVTISGGEPLVQWKFVMLLLRKLKEHGIHTAIETTGCIAPGIFRKAIADADLLLFDVKHYDSAKHKAGTAVDNEGILENLRYSIASGNEVLPRIPVIPGFNNAIEDAETLAKLLKDIGASSVQLLPFHQFGDKKYESLGIPYAMKDEKPLHADKLTLYKDTFLRHGIHAFF